MKSLYKLLFILFVLNNAIQTPLCAGQCAFSVDCENDDASCINGICTRKSFCRDGNCGGSKRAYDSLNLEDPY